MATETDSLDDLDEEQESAAGAEEDQEHSPAIPHTGLGSGTVFSVQAYALRRS